MYNLNNLVKKNINVLKNDLSNDFLYKLDYKRNLFYLNIVENIILLYQITNNNTQELFYNLAYNFDLLSKCLDIFTIYLLNNNKSKYQLAILFILSNIINNINNYINLLVTDTIFLNILTQKISNLNLLDLINNIDNDNDIDNIIIKNNNRIKKELLDILFKISDKI